MMKKTSRIILAVLIGTVLTALSYYLILPPLNVFSSDFWIYLIFVLAFYGVPLGAVNGLSVNVKGNTATPKGKQKVNKIFLALVGIPVAVLVVGHILSSTFFNAHKYATVIEVEQADFSADMPEADVVKVKVLSVDVQKKRIGLTMKFKE